MASWRLTLKACNSYERESVNLKELKYQCKKTLAL